MNKFQMAALALLSALSFSGCKQYAFSDVEAHYSTPGNIEVTFRVIDDYTGDAPDLKGQGIRKYLNILEDDERLSDKEGFKIDLPDTKRVNLKTLLVLDLSGSVANSLEVLKKAAITFVKSTVGNYSEAQIAIATFDGNEHITTQIEFTNDIPRLLSTISSLRPGNDPSTNLYGAIQESYQKLSRESAGGQAGTISKKSLIFFTDGKDRANRVSETQAIQAIDQAREEFSLVAAVVVGSEISEDFLRHFGRKYRGYYPVRDYTELSNVFENIGESLQRLANSYFTARVCSPKRNGIHFLTLEMKSFLGSVRSRTNIEFNATGFRAGCNGKDEAQWKNTQNWFNSALLDDYEIDNAKALFDAFGYAKNSVYFKQAARNPRQGGAVSTIWNFSPFSENSSVACHLNFLGNAEDIAPGEKLPLIHYNSYNGLYSDNLERFHGFQVMFAKNSSTYTLTCRPLHLMLHQKYSWREGSTQVDAYGLQTVNIVSETAQ
jgi:hypothetical protein